MSTVDVESRGVFKINKKNGCMTFFVTQPLLLQIQNSKSMDETRSEHCFLFSCDSISFACLSREGNFVISQFFNRNVISTGIFYCIGG